MKESKLFFYQVEAHDGHSWKPIPGLAYACSVGSFRQLFNLLKLAGVNPYTPSQGQRIRRVGDSLNFPEGDWKPSFLYVGQRGNLPAGLKDWPK